MKVEPQISDEMIKKDILSKLPADISKSIKLEKTEKSNLNMGWFIGTTACPYQIRRSTQKKGYDVLFREKSPFDETLGSIEPSKIVLLSFRYIRYDYD